MKIPRNVFSIVLMLVTTVCLGEDLGVTINVGINKAVANSWIKTLQEAYNQFLSFFVDLANNTIALELKTVREFKIAATVCFNTVKGKKYNSIGALKKTVTEVSHALVNAIVSGSRAVEDLNITHETKLHKKLTTVMEKLKAALQVTTNLVTPKNPAKNPPKSPPKTPKTPKTPANKKKSPPK